MPVFIGDVLESSGGPVLDMFNNQVIGFQVVGGALNDFGVPHSNGFTSTGWGSYLNSATHRTVLDIPEDLRAEGMIVYDSGKKRHFISKGASSFSSLANFEEIINDFSTYQEASDLVVDPTTGEGIEGSMGSAIASLGSEKYSFLMRQTSYLGDIITAGNSETHVRMSNLDLKNFVIQVLGQGVAQDLIEQGYGTVGSFTNSGSGVLGDIDGDGLVGVSDLVALLGLFGNQDLFCDLFLHIGGPNYESFNPTEVGGLQKAQFATIPPNPWLNNPYAYEAVDINWNSGGGTGFVRNGSSVDGSQFANALDIFLVNGSGGALIDDACYARVVESDNAATTLDQVLKSPSFQVLLGQQGGAADFPVAHSVSFSETSQNPLRGFLNFRFIDDQGDTVQTSSGSNFSRLEILNFPTNISPGFYNGNNTNPNENLSLTIGGNIWPSILEQYDYNNAPNSTEVVVSEMRVSLNYQSGGNVAFTQVENIDIQFKIA